MSITLPIGIGVTFCLMSCLPLYGQQPVVSWFQTLSRVHYFGFGSASYYGATSVGERSYDSLMRREDAVDLCKHLVVDGTPEARMYGLCGLRQLDPLLFRVYADIARRDRPSVLYVQVCTADEVQAATVVAMIDREWYAGQLPDPSWFAPY